MSTIPYNMEIILTFPFLGIKTQALQYYEDMSSAYIEIDRKLADRLADYIENHPWTQNTTTELLDDLFHYFLSIFERLAGFPGRKPFMQNETCKQNSKVIKQILKVLNIARDGADLSLHTLPDHSNLQILNS